MNYPNVIFFPVNNGSSTLLGLGEETFLMFDIKENTDDTDYSIYNYLRDTLPQNNYIRHLSVFALTHADKDHCQGFRDIFQTEKDQDDSKIIIDELWLSPALKNEIVYNGEKPCEDAIAIFEEAERRISLAKKNKDASKLDGNRIKIIGFSEDYKDLPDDNKLFPGETFSYFGKNGNELELFIHGPFKEDLEDENLNRNETSLIVQIGFKINGNTKKILLGGDASASIWEKVYTKSKKNNNLDKLKWDIFLTPHHSSYTFFEESREEARLNPAETSLNILEAGALKCYIISSSRKIRENNYPDNQPPHIQAVRHYRNTANNKKGDFLCTMENIDSKNLLKPILLNLSGNVIQQQSYGANIITNSSISQPAKYGDGGNSFAI